VKSGANLVGALFGTLVLLASGGCEKPSPSTDEPGLADGRQGATAIVARVAGEPVLVDEVLELGRGERGDREQRVEAAIARRLAAVEARRRGVADDPELREKLAALRRRAELREQSLLRDALFRQIRDGLEVSEADLQEHYEKTKRRYFERQLRLRRVPFGSQPEAEAATDLPSEGSEEIGPAAIPRLPRSVLPEVFQLKQPGDRVVAEHEGTWAVVELVEVLPAVPLPLEKVRDRVETSLRTLRAQAQMTELLARLREEAGVEIDAAVLEDDALWTDPEAEDAERRRALDRLRRRP
jgi:hypothetical protein